MQSTLLFSFGTYSALVVGLHYTSRDHLKLVFPRKVDELPINLGHQVFPKLELLELPHQTNGRGIALDHWPFVTH